MADGQVCGGFGCVDEHGEEEGCPGRGCWRKEEEGLI